MKNKGKIKSVPVRFCLGCGQRRPKRDLIRLVRTKEGEIRVDLTGKIAGRGGYFCPRHDCFKKGSRRLGKALRIEGKSLNWEAVKKDFEDVFKEVKSD